MADGQGIELGFSRVRPDARARLDGLGLLGDHAVYDTNRAAIAALLGPRSETTRRTSARKKGDMGAVIGDILPLALGIAISPIPIIAAILMLLSPKAKGTSVGFLLGWVLGIVVAVVVFTLLASVIPEQDPDAAKPISGVIKILLGVGAAVPRAPAVAQPPEARRGRGAAQVDGGDRPDDAGRGFVLGFLLSAVNPKNLLMAAGAGVIIGTGGLSVGEAALVDPGLRAHRRVLRRDPGDRLPRRVGADGRPARIAARLARAEQRDGHGGAAARDRRRR